jgi:hypothetical protein
MGTTQLQTIRTEVLETAGLATDDARFPDATLNRIINRALRTLSSYHDWPWNQDSETITTVASTVAYTPADSAWSKTLRLRYDNRDLLRYQPRDAARYANITGSPVGYYVEEDQIHIIPTPDGAYSIEHVYSEYETALSDDTDTADLPDRYIDWLVWEAVKLVAARIRDMDLFAMADRQTDDWMKRAHDEALRTKASIKVKTRSDWSV